MQNPSPSRVVAIFFFFNDTATTEIYTLSLHDALPIFLELGDQALRGERPSDQLRTRLQHLVGRRRPDRKSTRLNSSHLVISYAVFCLKKKRRSYPSLTASSSTPTPAISSSPHPITSGR